MPNSPFKIFYFQLCPPKCHRGRLRAEMLLWRQHSKYLTGAGIVSLLHKSFNGDRRWSSSHSAYHRRLTSGVTASLKRQPKQKRVLPAPIAETIEVKQAFAKPALSSYSIYRISIVDHRHQRQREGVRECICACNRERERETEMTSMALNICATHVQLMCRRVWDNPGELCSGGLQVAQRVRQG